jgi:hypothetical protein
MQKHPAYPNECSVSLPTATLPFVSASNQERPHYWNVPRAGDHVRDYSEAEAIGRQYALQFMQWLKENPELAGMGVLGWIASDIDFKNNEHSGYWVGFFSCIERVLFDAGTAA